MDEQFIDRARMREENEGMSTENADINYMEKSEFS